MQFNKTKTNKTNNTTQKHKKMSNTDPLNTGGERRFSPCYSCTVKSGKSLGSARGNKKST